jgi:ThiF family
MNGVRRWELFDPDVLDPINLVKHPRQRRDLGRSKVEIQKEWILDRNPSAEVNVHAVDVMSADSFRQSVERSRLVLCCADKKEVRQFVNAVAREHAKVCVTASVYRQGFGGEVYTYVPGHTGEELAKHPHCEEGGKYLGFIENEGESTRIVITDFLTGGPNAKRTRVEFLPDGDFQERLFRQAERLDRRVEHLGSWHSHHCNGLGIFSEGDIAGYFKTVNKAQYRPDLFVASLVTRIPESIEERDWLQHFLFVRGDDQFYRLDTDLRMVDAPTTLEKSLAIRNVGSTRRTRVDGSRMTRSCYRLKLWTRVCRERAGYGTNRKSAGVCWRRIGASSGSRSARG